MSLIDKTELTTLKSASEVKNVALSAIQTIEMMSVASAINTAANSGQLYTTWNQQLSEETQKALEAKKYKLEKSNVPLNHMFKISWEK